MQEQQVINNNPVGSEKHQAGAVHMLLISVCSSLLWLGSDFYLFFSLATKLKAIEWSICWLYFQSLVTNSYSNIHEHILFWIKVWWTVRFGLRSLVGKPNSALLSKNRVAISSPSPHAGCSLCFLLLFLIM